MKKETVATVHNEKGKATAVVKVPKTAQAKTKATEKKAASKTTAKKSQAKKPAPKKPAKEYTLTFTRDTFQKDITVAADFCERKSDSMPVLSHILISSDGKRHCKLTATDLEVSWSKIVPVAGPAVSKCVPATLLLKEIKALPEDVRDVVLKFKENVVSVNGRCRIFTLSADDYPTLPEAKKSSELQVDNLIAGLKSIVCAIGDADTKPALKGALLDFPAGRVVASDGHRLHFEKVTVRGKAKPIIIPKRAVKLMVKYPLSEIPELKREKGKSVSDKIDRSAEYELDVFGHKVKVKYEPYKHTDAAQVHLEGAVGEDGTESVFLYGIKLHVSKAGSLKDYLQDEAEKVYLKFNRTVFITAGDKHMTYPVAGGEMFVRTIEGSFPKYQKFIPKNPVKIVFNTEAFLRNLDGVTPLNNVVTLTANGKLQIKTSSSDMGDYKWQIDSKTTGKKNGSVTIKLSAKYLLDAIKAYRGREVTLEVKDPLTACLINKNAVVMPVR
jgi:DNA polymerase III sliding clamp (beta) subunit (PCNA family)